VYSKKKTFKRQTNHTTSEKKKKRKEGKKGKCEAFFTGQKGTKKIKQKRNNNFDQ